MREHKEEQPVLEAICAPIIGKALWDGKSGVVGRFAEVAENDEIGASRGGLRGIGVTEVTPVLFGLSGCPLRGLAPRLQEDAIRSRRAASSCEASALMLDQAEARCISL